MNLVRRHPLLLLIATGVAIRIALAFTFVGVNTDVGAYEAMANYLERDPFNAYELNEVWLGGTLFPAWPYPPGFMIWIGITSVIVDVTGLPFHGVIQLASIFADVAIALLIYAYLGWRGASAGLRLGGAATVLLGPSFIAVSGYQGQIDAVAALPAVLALIAWERRPESTRAAESGLLLGLGAAIKIPVGLVGLAMLSTARSVREGAVLTAVTLAVPLLMLVPFVIAFPDTVEWMTGYQGVPGRGSLTLVLDPSLAWDALAFGEAREATGLAGVVADGALMIVAAAVAGLAAFLLRFRPAPVDAAVVVWLALFAFTPSFAPAYILWGLPFFTMAGYVRQVAILQIALIPSTAIPFIAEGSGGLGEWAGALYVISMLCLWLFWVVALGTVGSRIVRRHEADPARPQEPLVGVT